MPLRDHFDKFSHQKFQWQSFHSCWVNTIVRQLNGPLLPARFRAEPYVQLKERDHEHVCETIVYDNERDCRRVSVIELVAPKNNDLELNRWECAQRLVHDLRTGAGIAIIDIVTSCHGSLIQTLMQSLGEGWLPEVGNLSAVAIRAVPLSQTPRLDVWFNTLEIGKPLPTLPLWIADDLAVPLDLEQSYEETCRVLRG